MGKEIIDDITNFIFVSLPPEKSDVIFLPGGSYAEVPEGGARLWREGLSPLIMPSGKFSVRDSAFCGVASHTELYTGKYLTECDFYTDVLVTGGVTPDSIIPENRAGSTRDNAQFSREVADSRQLRFEKAIICCKAYHARRCLMYYQMAFPDTRFTVCPVFCEGINVTRENWYDSAEGVALVLGELAKCGNQMTQLLPKYIGIN